MALRLRQLQQRTTRTGRLLQRQSALLGTQLDNDERYHLGTSSRSITTTAPIFAPLTLTTNSIVSRWGGAGAGREVFLFQKRAWTNEPVREPKKPPGGGRDGGRGGRGDSGGRGGGRPTRDHYYEVKESGMSRNKERDATLKNLETKSITVAKKKGSGAAKYCYGCGATIVAKSEIETPTGGGPNQGGVSMGVKSKRGGYWNERNEEIKISKIKNWALCTRCKSLKKNESKINYSQLEALSPSHEMTQVFRDQVSKIRGKPDVVVVLCVDAVNVKGSLIKKLRNYVGGNPILLAVTRCDLLPDYIREDWSHEKEAQIKVFFAKQAAELKPAGVYLCSVDDEDKPDEIFRGAEQLAEDLFNHLDGRDPYIVGAANIGKSTLTDRLVDDMVDRATESTRERDFNKYKHKRDYSRFAPRSESQRDQRRFDAIQDYRVTKSSLPGTTLQNVRVPCFQDHLHALWDTPGLLLDPSLAHYPIRNLRRLKAMRPQQIQPQWHEVHEKSFAFQVFEEESFDTDEDPLPLLRIEVRLKREGDEEAGPVHLVWNSTLNDILATAVQSIESAHADEKRRKADIEQKLKPKEQEQPEPVERTPEEKRLYKEQRKREYEERIKSEKEELGAKEWHRQKEEKTHQYNRLKTLQQLQKINEEQFIAGKAMDIDIAHFGSLSILSPRTTMVRVFATSEGVVARLQQAMVVPPQWEEYLFASSTADNERRNVDREEGLDDDEFYDSEDDGDEEYFDFEEDDYFGDEQDYYIGDQDYFEEEDRARSYGSGFVKPKKVRRWTEFSGENIGWKFDDYNRMVDGKLMDGWNPITENTLDTELSEAGKQYKKSIQK